MGIIGRQEAAAKTARKNSIKGKKCGNKGAAVRYVERNPVRAGVVTRAEEYPWSSAAAHCGSCTDALLSNESPGKGVIDDWAAWLRNEEDEDAVNRIRRQTHTGRPCGTPAFLTRLESLLSRVLGPNRRGRKRKTAGEEAVKP
jgi:putative transposase